MLLARSIPDLRSDYLVLDLDQLGGVLEGDCGHDVGWHFVLAEAVENMGLANPSVSH